MNNKTSYQVTVSKLVDGKPSEQVQAIAADKTRPVVFKAVPGATYTFVDKGSNKAPQQIHTRRQGKHLLIQLDAYQPGAQPDLVLENFYDGEPGTFAGLAEDQATYPFIPDTARDTDQIATLADGRTLTQVLGGSPLEAAAAAPALAVAALALGPLGLVGAGVVGAAVIGGGGGGGGGTGVSLSSALKTESDSGVKGDNLTNVKRPTIGGKTDAGNKVYVKLENGTEQEAVVDKDGNWTWTPTADMTQGTQTVSVRAVNPSTGKEANGTVRLTIDALGLAATVTSNFEALNTVKTEGSPGVLNIQESKDGVTFTIKFDGAPTRDLTLGDLTLANGSFKTGSFTRVSDTEYTVIGQVEPNAEKQLQLGWSDSGKGLMDKAGNTLANPTGVNSVSYDTRALSSSITSNFAELDKVQTDGVLNIQEGKDGVTFSIKLSEAGARNLTQNDLTISGGSFKPGSFSVISATEYTVIANLGTESQLQVGLSASGQALTDVAGNPLTLPSEVISLKYDNVAPRFNLLGEPATTEVDSTNNVPLNWGLIGEQTDLSYYQLRLLNEVKAANAAPPAGLTLKQAGLSYLPPGYYTLSATLTDQAGNATSDHQVLKVDRGALQPDFWSDSSSEPPVGNSNDQLFINRAGSQTFDGMGSSATGGSDKFIWLARDTSTAGSPDVDVIKNFDLTRGAQQDFVDIKDLLGDIHTFENHVKISQLDSDTSRAGNESILISISKNGLFTGGSTSSDVITQKIILELSNPSLLSDPGWLTNFRDSGSLIWDTSTFGTVLVL